MEIVHSVADLRGAILFHRRAGRSVGFVPTMGMLHDGQLSLARRARIQNGCVVVSRAPGEERDEARDTTLLERERVDIAFVPDQETLASTDDLTRVMVEGLTSRLEGASRPGYLDGLATVTLKLLHLVGPARLYLGQKDAQRVVVLRRMVRDLSVNVELVICPTVRDPDGLAVSSANAALSIEERHAATCLSVALRAAEDTHASGERSAEVLRARMTETIAAEAMARPDYISVADADSLAEIQRIERPALALLAVWIGRIRLTDNLPLG